jgi:hypothetical protein
MKTMFKVTLVFALFLAAHTVWASGNLSVNIQPISAEKVVVAISSLTESNLKITVEDQKNRIVYYNETSEPKGDYRKIFDFSELENGSYKLSVVSKNLTAEREFQISKGEVKVGKEKTTLEPFFGYEDGLLRYSYLNFDNENVTMYFLDKNDLIYSKEIGNTFNVNGALNLSKLKKGDYSVILSAGEKEFTYQVDIR